MEKQAIIYVRVSTSQQSTLSQTEELCGRAEYLGLDVIAIIEEKISGKTKMSERAGITKLRTLIKKHRVTTVLFSDVSRIGRNLYESRILINELTEAGINCHIRDINLNTLDPDGRPSPFNDLIMNLLMSIYEYQRADIVAKVKVGKKNSKIKQGRKVGSVKSNTNLLKEHKHIVAHLKAAQIDTKLSIRKIAELCTCSTTTVQKVKRAMAA